MSIEGFTKHDFATFEIEGLEPRMDALRTRIQPKFKALGEPLAEELSNMIGADMFLHIAKHARRTKNPPKDSWLAIAHNQRGYKKHPHFQVGLFDDRLFIWLAYIYELPNKERIATLFIDKQNEFQQLPQNFMISLDHMQKEARSLEEMSEEDVQAALERFRDVKKGEFLIGKQIDKGDPIVHNGEELFTTIMDTYKKLLPFYQQTIDVR